MNDQLSLPIGPRRVDALVEAQPNNAIMRKVARIFDVDVQGIRKAGVITKHAPDLVASIEAGTMTLDEALTEIERRLTR